MNKNAEVDYGIACNIVNGRSSTENEMRMAKATISALAEKGHRSAIAKIMEDPDSYDADIDKMIGEIGDQDFKIECCRLLARHYRNRSNLRKASRYASISLSCGCVDDLRLCNPEDSVKTLDTLDPSRYSIETVIDAAMKYCSIGITDNRWSDELFDRLNDHIESCMVFQFLHRNPYWLFGNERAEEAIWMVRRWTESNLDRLNRSALILLNSFFTYVKEVPWDEDESLSLHRRIGIALLQKGDPCYLSSEWVIKSIIKEDGSLDMAEIHEFIAISDKKTVYSALADNRRLDNEIRLPLAEKAIELGSDTGRKVKAKIIFGDGSGDVLGAMRLMLQCEDLSETYLYIRECYEILSGAQYGDPMALELYRAEHKHSIPENILSELRKRFLDRPSG